MALPHFSKQPKSVDGAALVGVHLVGAMDFVNQMFSRFSQALRRENAFTMSRLRSVIQNSYDPKPITSVILQTWDFKHFIETEPKLFRTLNDITHNQQYKFKLASTLDVRVWCKKFSTDQTWEPPAGVKNYVNADGARLMLASQQLPLKSYAEIKRQTKRAQNIGTLETAQEGDVVRHVQAIRQDIQAHCYPFFEDVEKDWWNHWFFQQEDIGRNIGRSIRERLTDMCWLWPVPPERDAEEEVELLAVTTAEDLRRRVFGIRRPIYSGPRKPPPGSAAADRAAHIGELTEIHDKSFLAVLAEDEISFWICQVLKINGRNEAGEPTEVMIQWYATEDSNPYTGKFYPEKRRSNGKGRPVLFRQEVNLEAVTILSFNFIFTTTRRLCRITERQIRTGLFRIARDKEASELDGNISPASDIVSADDEETDCSGPDSDPDVQ
ncbi:hypothetical protein R1sor_013035 [Riccia sorocarpa]|uniref:DUF7869 domain-containing protein n=1 Tax=Riccia sorocarpa TaxID=122646 RepID=A0ABD3H9E9_9MARC